MRLTNFLIIVVFTGWPHFVVNAKPTELVIYHDADYSINVSSAKSMKMGMLTALSEVEHSINGVKVRLVSKDHRGNIRRSKANMQQFLQEPNGLFVLGGLHSPPYIKNRTFINTSQIPLLVPWAAGGPVTRYADGENWVFRLSVDDTKAGIRISEFALQNKQCKSPHLLLEDTPWGKSNHKTMSSYLDNKVPFDVTWFGWNTKQNTAKTLIRNAMSSGADCILLVANYTESKQFLNAMLAFPKEQRLPFISHWGLTGGNTERLMTPEVKSGVELHFIQSCFSFAKPHKPFTLTTINQAREQFPIEFTQPELLASPAGFVHAFDLGRIAISALHQINLNKDIAAIRAEFKAALENLNQPVQGLIKQYNKPFTVWSETKDDAHEALGLDDFCMAQFGAQNQVEVKYH